MKIKYYLHSKIYIYNNNNNNKQNYIFLYCSLCDKGNKVANVYPRDFTSLKKAITTIAIRLLGNDYNVYIIL